MDHIVSFLFKYRTAIFSKSQFGFGARPSVLVIITLALVLGLFVYFVYFRASTKLPLGWRIALIGLRCALVAVIAFCLMRPVIVVPAITPQSSYVAVLMDDSSSMLLEADGAGNRLDAVKRLMTIGSPFETQLAEKFKVRAYKFSDKAERVGDATELRGAGERTDLAGVIQQAARDAAGLPLAGVVILSDGAHNGAAEEDFNNALGALRARNLPIFTVGVGQTSLDGDIELVRATAPRRSLAGSPVTAELLVRASGGGERTVKIDLKEDNHHLMSRQVPVPGEATTVARITFTPSSPGLHRYVFTAEPSPEEPVSDNNSQEFVIEVEDTNPRVLYIEGEPRWEYGKLRAALADEKNVVLVSVLRSADGKFYRQGVESGEELTSGFPTSEEEIFKYDAIVIGSIEATFFTFDQLRAIEQFVSRRGGAMMMIGGAKAFNAGGYGNTPMADLLPVYLRGEATPGGNQEFKAAPSERGRDNPAARLADQAETNQRAWEQMPAITLSEIITETKPGATVILQAASAKQKGQVVPMLIEQRYGRGRSLALLASDTWRWRMMLESKNKSYETFWRNLLRYLVENTRHTVEAATERSFYGLEEPVRIRVEVADEKFLSVRDALVTARITSPTGRSVEVPMKPVVEGGFEGYAGTALPDEDGLYRVEVTARRVGKSEGVIGSAQTSFVAGPLNREARDAAQNRELLERIAADTGGAYYTSDRVSNLVEDLTHTEGAGSVRVTYDLWDMPINFLLVVALAAAEWFIRKRKGLA